MGTFLKENAGSLEKITSVCKYGIKQKPVSLARSNFPHYKNCPKFKHSTWQVNL